MKGQIKPKLISIIIPLYNFRIEQASSMLAIFSGVVGLLFLLWMFHDFIWKTPPSVERQLGKPDQPIEYNLVHTVSHVVMPGRRGTP